MGPLLEQVQCKNYIIFRKKYQILIVVNNQESGIGVFLLGVFLLGSLLVFAYFCVFLRISAYCLGISAYFPPPTAKLAANAQNLGVFGCVWGVLTSGVLSPQFAEYVPVLR